MVRINLSSLLEEVSSGMRCGHYSFAVSGYYDLNPTTGKMTEVFDTEVDPSWVMRLTENLKWVNKQDGKAGRLYLTLEGYEKLRPKLIEAITECCTIEEVDEYFREFLRRITRTYKPFEADAALV